MKLSIQYLRQRHDFWLSRMGDAGIWNPALFRNVDFVIRKNHKRFNALFQRRIKIVAGVREISDKIVFYNRVDDFDPRFIDNVLVHEMIHQYIIQNDIKDTSPHGRIFKTFMNRINHSFPEELCIRIRDINPNVPVKGEGKICHTLLLVHFNDLSSICAVVNPAKFDYFDSLVKRNKRNWNIKSHRWAQSNDVYFNRFSRCTSRLHGLRIKSSELERFCRDFNISFRQNDGISSPQKKIWDWLRRR